MKAIRSINIKIVSLSPHVHVSAFTLSIRLEISTGKERMENKFTDLASISTEPSNWVASFLDSSADGIEARMLASSGTYGEWEARPFAHYKCERNSQTS